MVTEATLALLPFCHEKAPFEFLNSFAMPPYTPWVPHSQNAGFDPVTLVRVRAAKDSELPSDIGYPELLRASLLSNNDLGPNAALLVAGAALQSRIPCRMWLNDIRNGHYGDAIPELERIYEIARAIYGPLKGEDSSFAVRVSTLHIPALLGISPGYCRNGLRPLVPVSAFSIPCDTAWKGARQRKHRAKTTGVGSPRSHTTD